MAGKYKAYPKYQDSGVEWLGSLPEHWKIYPTKRLFRLVTEASEPNNDHELLSVYTDIGVKPRKELEQRGNKSSTTDGYWLVKEGDIVVNKLLAWMGAIGHSSYNGVTSPAYDILRKTKSFNTRFYHYLFRNKIAQQEFKRWSRGIMEMRLRLYFEELGRIPMPFPPEAEIEQIMRFLDHETGKIDLLIEKQQELIALLKEKRQAVISHAVTKGLNPQAPLKDSGIEWLGQVPEHWEVAPLGYLVTSSGGGTPSKENPKFWNGPIPWVTPKDMKRDYIDSSIDQITERAITYSAAKTISKGAVLMVVRGMILDHSVPVALTTTNVTVNQDMKALEPCSKLQSEFLLFSLKGNKDRLLDYVETSGHGTKCLRSELFDKIEIPFPPREEQLRIVEELKEQLRVFDQLVRKSLSQITLLQERRTALISAAVTGKIDVRDWEPPKEVSSATSSSQVN